MKPFINLDDLNNFVETDDGPFQDRNANISEQIGAKKLGYSLTIVPPGKKFCPFHNHRVAEELFLILEGEGTLRFGDNTYAIRKHDIIACPPGGKEVAHQIINTSDRDIKYLSLGTHEVAEICEYPDSGKVMSMAGKSGRRDFRHMSRERDAVDYFDAEE